MLTLPYESAGGNDELIEIYYYDKERQRWEVQPTISRDTVEKTITIEVKHFSDYVAGMSSFKVDEAGTLGGSGQLGPRVDPYLGALTIESEEFFIPARGIPLSLNAKLSTRTL
jgi:hypothetical protein